MLEFKVAAKHDPLEQVDRSRRSDRFALGVLDEVPKSIPLIEGNVYIIASWDSNTYIRAGKNNSFTVVDQYGTELKTNKEYVLINPEF